MENPEAKRVANRKEDDRISQLPEPILHHILCFLSQKKSVQTSVLSKSWRHLGPTRPIIDLRVTCDYGDRRHVRRIDKGACENCYKGDNEAFISAVDNTFRRYHHHNLFPKELRLDMLYLDSQSISVLEKWIPILFIKPNTCVDVFHISLGRWTKFDMPSVVFTVESLRELHLEGCRLNNIISIDNLMLKNLQKLSLSKLCISHDALEKILSGCPLVKRLVLYYCVGFKTINIGNKNRHLNYFHMFCYDTSIAINAPTLESIRIIGTEPNWYPNNTNYFPHLKSLRLSYVTLSTELFHNISCNFPCLQELTLHDCRGFEEIELSSCSIKRLIIHGSRNVAIEVPNILYFELSNRFLPTSLSLGTTTDNREWKSHLNFHRCLYGYENDVLRSILMLFGLVKEVSQSQISLTLYETFDFKMNRIEWDFNDRPIVLEHLVLNMHKQRCPDSRTHYLNALFRIFRPRYCMRQKRWNNDMENTKFLWKTLIHEREKTKYGWEQHLEEVRIEAFDEKGKVWSHVEWKCLPKSSEDPEIRFRLKWRD